MDAVGFVVAAGGQTDTGERRGIEDPVRWRQWQYRLNEAAVVLESNIAVEVKATAAVDDVMFERRLRYPTHHHVACGAPWESQRRR